MAFVAGTISLVATPTSNQAQLVVSASTGGVGAVGQQWYRDLSAGFVPAPANAVPGAVNLSLTDSSLIPNTVYYYKVVFTDSDAPPASVTSAASAAVSTPAASQSQNQFAQAPFLGMLDLKVGPGNVIAAQVDVSSPSPIYAGSAVQLVNSALPGGLPKVVPVSDTVGSTVSGVFAFAVYDIKSRQYNAGANLEVALAWSCMWLYATKAIQAGEQVILDPASPGAVQPREQVPPVPASSSIVGFALDRATAYGQLIRVVTAAPSYTKTP